MNPIQLRFIYSPGEAKYRYTKANIEVVNTAGVIKDKETYYLYNSDTIFSGSFQRYIISNVTNPNLGNMTLQHQTQDSFVATFRNEENTKLPLDTICAKVPFRLMGSINILRAYYYDNTADGYVDSMYVVVQTDLVGGLTIDHVNQIKDSIILPAFRKLTITSQGITTGGFYVKINEDKSKYPTTYVTKDDSLIIKGCILTIGGWMIGKKAPIHDKIAPLIQWAPGKAFLVDNIIASMDDTLGVRFSEPVKYISSKGPFYIKSLKDNSIFIPLLISISQPGPDSMVFVVDRNNTKVMSDGDSIWIHEGSCVGDICQNEQGVETYNYQNNVNNTKRRLYVDSSNIGINTGLVVPKINFVSQNFPNPFSSATSIKYGVCQFAKVTIEVYDLNGKLIDKLVNKNQKPGRYLVKWDSHDNSNGIYIYSAKIGKEFSQIKRMFLVK